MKRIHLLRVEPHSSLDPYRPLIDAVRADGGRAGTLRWRPETPLGDEGLTEAATCGLLRAVVVGADGAVARKPRTGRAVLRDVLREHFRGCRLVLVEGEAVGELETVPRISPLSDGRFRVEGGESVRQVSAGELASLLRRPAIS